MIKKIEKLPNFTEYMIIKEGVVGENTCEIFENGKGCKYYNKEKGCISKKA